ncbi:hypothetical protein [Kocuria massiliensis]|uniref:hypothetical protein n=1 Tax=Kocuria massiliensis TaxID=1926282 RepID=UPI0022B9AA42|nr:hypothetical protein [Kocuria massiliensis]
MDQPDGNLPLTRAEFEQYLEIRRVQDEMLNERVDYAIAMANYAAMLNDKRNTTKLIPYPDNEQEQQHGK